MQKSLARWWLLLGVAALAIAGLFSLVLVVARAPETSDIQLFTDIFHKTLVVHVDLSVLVWFMAITCMLWSVTVENKHASIPFIEEAALICFALAIAVITLSPLDPHGAALMSNYIPVIYSPFFFFGLSLLFCGVLLMLARFFTSSLLTLSPARPIRMALLGAAGITLISAAAFGWSYLQMPDTTRDQPYYDMLFWGGGHMLQFSNAQIAMICWLLLIKKLKPEFHVYPKHLFAILILGPVSAILGLGIYIPYPVGTPEHHAFFTKLMILCNGIAPTIMALWILPGMWSFRILRFGKYRALWSTLFASLLLFIYGGVLGALIEGQNVTVPAHYHGSIVGITLAFMGVAYLILPRFGYRDVAGWKLAYWQPVVYGIGQFMHISGLAWSGGYGVLRKTPGGMDALPASAKAAMGLMGLGGLLAIIGGFMFVLVVFKAVRKTSDHAAV